ncbi:hypothetical protein M3J09_010512 [Ascochyta lentis]
MEFLISHALLSCFRLFVLYPGLLSTF